MATDPLPARRIDKREVRLAFLHQYCPADYVDDTKFFTLTLQLGSGIRWREFGPGAWHFDPDYDTTPGDKTGKRQHPAIYENIGPFPGTIVNGLVETMNQWVQDNINEVTPAGLINRQLVVSNFVECDAPPVVGVRRAETEAIVDGLRVAGKEIAQEIVAALRQK